MGMQSLNIRPSGPSRKASGDRRGLLLFGICLLVAASIVAVIIVAYESGFIGGLGLSG
jgi:hypothetical protein